MSYTPKLDATIDVVKVLLPLFGNPKGAKGL
jgi:hypothetical protein